MSRYFISDDGHWINEDFDRLGSLLQDYDPYLQLQWIPPDARTDKDLTPPYRVVDTRNNEIVITFREIDDPTQILSRIWASDAKQGDVLQRLDTNNAAAEALALKEQMDMAEERNDIAAFLMKTKKNTIQHKGKKFDDQMRRIT